MPGNCHNSQFLPVTDISKYPGVTPTEFQSLRYHEHFATLLSCEVVFLGLFLSAFQECFI